MKRIKKIAWLVLLTGFISNLNSCVVVEKRVQPRTYHRGHPPGQHRGWYHRRQRPTQTVIIVPANGNGNHHGHGHRR